MTQAAVKSMGVSLSEISKNGPFFEDGCTILLAFHTWPFSTSTTSPSKDLSSQMKIIGLTLHDFEICNFLREMKVACLDQSFGLLVKCTETLSNFDGLGGKSWVSQPGDRTQEWKERQCKWCQARQPMELENLVESLQRFAPGVRSWEVPEMADLVMWENMKLCSWSPCWFL